MNITKEKVKEEKLKLLQKVKTEEEIDKIKNNIYKEVDEILEKFIEKEDDDIIEE